MNYKFTNTWFDYTGGIITQSLFPRVNPSRILEIGSYEGRSTCAFIESVANDRPLEIHCVDTWKGGIEHVSDDMGDVESRFAHNVDLATNNVKHKVDLHTHKGLSDFHLAKLLAEGKRNYFDFVYVDGSHQAPDVLCDAVLAFRLLKLGGMMAFDDYLWHEHDADKKDMARCPKMAIDAFINLYWRKLEIPHLAPLYQMYVQKIAN